MSYVFRGVTLPDHLKESLDAYVEHGRPTGGFLAACIDNSLRAAVSYADEDNIVIIPAIVGYLYNHCPRGCWGFPGASEQWIERKQKERESSARQVRP